MTDIVVSNGKTYPQDNLAVGTRPYTDRAYTFTSVPSQFIGQAVIITANADKTATNGDFLRFNLANNATVAVLFDNRVTKLPAWLDDGTWSLAGDIIGTSDTPRRIYQKDYPAGLVQLGGNAMAPMSGARSMYNVVVAEGPPVEDPPPTDEPPADEPPPDDNGSDPPPDDAENSPPPASDPKPEPENSDPNQELVVNATFANDISGWDTSISTLDGSVKWNTGRMEIGSGGGGYGQAQQKISLVPGENYCFSLDVEGTLTYAYAGISTESQDTDRIFLIDPRDPGHYQRCFIAPKDHVYILLGSGGFTWFADNVSVRWDDPVDDPPADDPPPDDDSGDGGAGSNPPVVLIPTEGQVFPASFGEQFDKSLLVRIPEGVTASCELNTDYAGSYPVAANLSVHTGCSIRIKPIAGIIGNEYVVPVRINYVSGELAGVVYHTFIVKIIDGPDPNEPAILSPTQNEILYVAPGQTFSKIAQIQMPSGATWFCSRTNVNTSAQNPKAPNELTVNNNTCEIRWAPTSSNAGIRYEVSLQVHYTAGNTTGDVYSLFYVEVTGNPPPPPPFPDITYPQENQEFSVRIGEQISIGIQTTNYPDPLWYFLSTRPSNMTLDDQEGVIRWTPGSNYTIGQQYEVTFYIKDTPPAVQGREKYGRFYITVLAPDDAPPDNPPPPTPEPTPTPGPTPDGGNILTAEELQDIQRQIDEIAAALQEMQKQAALLLQQNTPSCTVTYTVRSGDTLSGISLHYYGDATKWPEIYDVNKVIIGSNPDLIIPGQKLCVPGQVKTISETETVSPPAAAVAPRPALILEPHDLFWHETNTANFSGEGDPGSKVILTNGQGLAIGIATVSSDRSWSMSNIPTPEGNTVYTIYAIKDGKRSKKIDYPYYRASTARKWLTKVSVISDSRFAHIIMGEGGTVGDVAANFGINAIPIVGMFPNGVDVGAQLTYVITDNPKADGFILGLAIVGAGLEFANPTVDPSEIIAAGYKGLLVKSPNTAKIIRESLQGNLDDILSGKSIVLGVSKLRVYAKILSNPDGLIRLVDEGGAPALQFAEKMVGKYPSTTFDWARNPEQFSIHAWGDHREMWEALGIVDEAHFQRVLDDVIRDGRKVIYRQFDKQGNLIGDEYGFYDASKNIFIAAKEDGRLWTAFRPGTNWKQAGEGLNYVMSRKWVLEIQ